MPYIHALTENSDEIDEDEFYEEVSRNYDRLPESVIKIVLGDNKFKNRKETNVQTHFWNRKCTQREQRLYEPLNNLICDI